MSVNLSLFFNSVQFMYIHLMKVFKVLYMWMLNDVLS